jgi:uncharacterized protein
LRTSDGTSKLSGAPGSDLIVVSDTSPIRALDHLELLPLLTRMFGTVVVPRAVATELARPRRRFRAIRAEALPGATVVAARDREQVALLQRTLDEGEAEAIVLAIELRADLLLIDELDGRRIAVEQGLTTTGVLGVLVRAKTQRLVPELAPWRSVFATSWAFI